MDADAAETLPMLPAAGLPDAASPHALSEAALGYARQALSPATRRAYGSHLRAWEAWCAAKGAVAAPAAPALVANHLAELAGTRAYVTLTSRVSDIAQAHALLRLPGDLRGERDHALLLLGFAGAFRRSELVGIRVGDLAFGPHGLSVFLPRSKADQVGEGSVVNIAANPMSAHCPVRAVRAWLDRAGIGQGWVFRRISRDDAIGRRGLSAESMRLILKARARDAGYKKADLARITPHSLRAGCITTLAQASVHERDIMKHSRHGSQAVMRTYIRAAGVEEAFTSGALWRRKNP